MDDAADCLARAWRQKSRDSPCKRIGSAETVAVGTGKLFAVVKTRPLNLKSIQLPLLFPIGLTPDQPFSPSRISIAFAGMRPSG